MIHFAATLGGYAANAVRSYRGACHCSDHSAASHALPGLIGRGNRRALKHQPTLRSPTVAEHVLY
jgi:hypothetical protein